MSYARRAAARLEFAQNQSRPTDEFAQLGYAAVYALLGILDELRTANMIHGFAIGVPDTLAREHDVRDLIAQRITEPEPTTEDGE